MADKKQTENFVKSIDFTDLLPKMQVGHRRLIRFMRKHFLTEMKNRQVSTIRIQRLTIDKNLKVKSV